MRRTTVPTLATLLGAWLLFGASTAAQAGFIAASVDRQSSAPAADSSSMAPAREDAGDPSPLPEILRWQQHAACANPFAPASGGTAGAPTTSASSSGAPAAILPVAADSHAELITRLAPERESWLPPPFFTGIFRPPRNQVQQIVAL